MKLKDVKNTSSEATVLVAARIPISYKHFLVKHKISPKSVLCKGIEELMEEDMTPLNKTNPHKKPKEDIRKR